MIILSINSVSFFYFENGCGAVGVVQFF